MVALSFDDGPGPETEGLFKALLSHHVPGTFFMVGERVSALMEHRGGARLLREMVDHGMETSATTPTTIPGNSRPRAKAPRFSSN